jgi:hypothetical protein
MRTVLTTIRDKFAKDEAQGYRSRDRQYAISMIDTRSLEERIIK